MNGRFNAEKQSSFPDISIKRSFLESVHYQCRGFAFGFFANFVLQMWQYFKKNIPTETHLQQITVRKIRSISEFPPKIKSGCPFDLLRN